MVSITWCIESFLRKPAGRHLAELLFANEMRNEGVGGAGERVLKLESCCWFFLPYVGPVLDASLVDFGSRSTSYGSRLGPY